MLELLLKLFAPKKETSSSIAKDRLKLVLVHDRSNSSDDLLEKIKEEILDVISKYMDIDTEGLDIQITQTESTESYLLWPNMCNPILPLAPVVCINATGYSRVWGIVSLP